MALISHFAFDNVTDGKVVAASLFKNGYAVIVREAELGSDHTVSIRPPSNAVLGTVWISGSKGVNIQRALSTWNDIPGQRNVTSLEEVLQANLERIVTVETTATYSGQNLLLKGRIISVDGSTLILEQEKDRIALLKSSIVRVTGADHGLEFRLPTSNRENVLKVTAEGSGKIYLVSLQRGMTWSPSYQLDISDEKESSLLGKGTILNDLAPLEGISVNLVTGFPNMRFLGFTDPFTSGVSVDQFVQGLAYASVDKEYKRDAVMQNQAPGGRFADTEFEPMQPTGSGEQLEDLFFYKQPNVSLKVGERGYYTLIQSKGEYRQEYTLDIPDSEWNSPRNTSPQSLDPVLDVWHTIIFKNTANQPLTTGSITTIKNGEVLGQDMLSYTSVGREASVKVSKALDIRAEAIEEEVARERGALKLENRATFDRVTIKGTIEIKNNRPKDVQMRISKVASGEVLESASATVKKTPAGLRQVNPVSQITWKPKLESGKSIRLEYKMSVLVPSNGY